MTQHSQPRRVLMTADTIGGVWTYAIELAAGLRPHGVDVILATMGGPVSTAQKEQLSRLPHVKLCESNYRLEWMDDPWEHVERAGLWLQALERRYAPDIVHVNGFAHASLPWMAPVLTVGHSCVLSWFAAVKGHPAPSEWRRYACEVRRGLQAANCVVAPTNAMLRELIRCYGPLPNHQVIPNGRHPRTFAPAAKEPFVLSVGRLWDEAKNVGLLCEVAPALAWPVTVAGCAAAPDHAPVALPNVDCLGRLAPPELADLYARAAIYALPARYEPFGLSALEAALSGCALVLGDIQSLREVWGDTAVFVPPNCPGAWRDALNSLIADPPRAAALGRAARLRASLYTRARFASDYFNLYSRLVRNRTSREPANAA
ncbi:MAG TPA: glycosyltransferase family 4 protein [Prosthecobacter sp.]|nr:glycosyltransferase family 4 protein [Prosthecobacter sp.]